MLEICSAILLLAPVPTAIIAITAPTPIIMPNMVRAERILFTLNALNDILIVEGMLIMIFPTFSSLIMSVQKSYYPSAVCGYISLMGHQYYRNV